MVRSREISEYPLLRYHATRYACYFYPLFLFHTTKFVGLREAPSFGIREIERFACAAAGLSN